MRRTLLLGAVPLVGLLGLLLLPQDAQAQRYWGGGRMYGDGIGYGRGYYGGYYGSPFGDYGYRSYPGYGYSYYYPDNGYTYYNNTFEQTYPVSNNYYSTQYANYPQGQNQQDVFYDANGQAWEVPGGNPQDNTRMIFLEVRVPQDARVWIDNHETQMRGTQRMFYSPPVTQGQSYTYEVKAQWKDASGQDVTRTQKVTVQPGQITPVDMIAGQQNIPRQQNSQQPVYQQQPINQQQPVNQQPVNQQQPINPQQNLQQPNAPQQNPPQQRIPPQSRANMPILVAQATGAPAGQAPPVGAGQPPVGAGQPPVGTGQPGTVTPGSGTTLPSTVPGQTINPGSQNLPTPNPNAQPGGPPIPTTRPMITPTTPIQPVPQVNPGAQNLPTPNPNAEPGGTPAPPIRPVPPELP